MRPKKPANSKKSIGQSDKSFRRTKPVTEIAAGGIVYKRTPKGVRLALIRDPYGKWTFAKGHQEAGETLGQAAIRETREEMGLGRLKLIRPLGKIEIWFRDRYRPGSRGSLIHKYIHYFLFEAPATAKGQPQKKEKISRLAWVTPAGAKRLNGYADVRPLLEKAISQLTRPAIKPPTLEKDKGAIKRENRS